MYAIQLALHPLTSLLLPGLVEYALLGLAVSQLVSGYGKGGLIILGLHLRLQNDLGWLIWLWTRSSRVKPKTLHKKQVLRSDMKETEHSVYAVICLVSWEGTAQLRYLSLLFKHKGAFLTQEFSATVM